MIRLEHLAPGFGSTAVAEYLADVQAQAHRDLVKAPQHLEFLSRVLDVWADAATTTNRRILDRAGAALAVAQFARHLPPPMSAHRDTAGGFGELVENRWLIPIATVAGRTMYRAQAGTPFGAIERPHR